MRTVQIKVNQILEITSCAEAYGFDNYMFFDCMKELLENKLSDAEIETYSRSVESIEGYGEEDYEDIKERLTDFKNKYITNQ